MSRRRFYVPRDSIHDGVAALPPSQAHHLRNVLRLGAGDIVEIFDGEGSGYVGSVEIRGSRVRIRDLEKIPFEKARIALTLAVALIKSSKFEWILEKATELGIEEIIPLTTRFSEIRIADSRIDSRLERWNRIVQEASRQCGRFSAPQVHKPLSFQESLRVQGLSTGAKLLFYEKAEAYWKPEPIHFTERIVLCVGPEGGWDPEEIKQATEAGYQIFSLGPFVLRAETAAIAAVSIVQHQIHLLDAENADLR